MNEQCLAGHRWEGWRAVSIQIEGVKLYNLIDLIVRDASCSRRQRTTIRRSGEGRGRPPVAAAAAEKQDEDPSGINNHAKRGSDMIQLATT